MKAVLQRVSQASVSFDNERVGSIDHGLLLLVGVHEEDTKERMQWLANKILKLRIFDDEAGKMNLSVQDIDGDILVVSQFTLYGDYEKGNRPSYMEAANHDKAKKLYEQMIRFFKDQSDLKVQSGKFGAYMNVELNNDGPVTLVLER